MLKDEQRSNILHIRQNLSISYVKMQSLEIVKKLLNLNILDRYDTIGIYLPIKNEVDVKYLMNILKNKTFCVPIIQNNEMFFGKYDLSMKLTESKFCTKIPEKIVKISPKICIIPMVAFDNEMNRIGYGKGYYDMYLKQSPECYKIGVAFKEQKVASIQIGIHDVKMDLIVINEKENINK